MHVLFHAPTPTANIKSKIVRDNEIHLYIHHNGSERRSKRHVFETALGVRQGGPESPTLFNLFIDYVMRVFLKLCKERGINFLNTNYAIPSLASPTNETSNLGCFGKLIVDWIGYADDLALCFNSLDDLQNGIKTLDETFRRYNLMINGTQTKNSLNKQQTD